MQAFRLPADAFRRPRQYQGPGLQQPQHFAPLVGRDGKFAIDGLTVEQDQQFFEQSNYWGQVGGRSDGAGSGLLPDAPALAAGDEGRIAALGPVDHTVRRTGIGIVGKRDARTQYATQHRLHEHLVVAFGLAIGGDHLLDCLGQGITIDVGQGQEGARIRGQRIVFAPAT